MKTICFYILILMSHLTFLAQQKIKVPEVKESKIIDSVLNINLPKSIPNNSCVILEVHHIGYMYDLYIDLVKTNLSTIDLYRHDLKNNLRFFRYKGYLIFVTGPNDPYNFFIGSSKIVEFYFKDTGSNTQGSISKDSNENYLEMYSYQNGHFVTILKSLH